jgi:hypothetical protein
MPTLRVLLNAAPDAGRADPWALFDDNESVVNSGVGTPDAWPAAQRSEAVLAAKCVRIVALQLPPLPPDRVRAAASFALEDQLAGPAEEQHIAVSPQRADGAVEAIVASRALIAELAPHFDRILAEPALAPRPAAQRWRWYASGAGGGFVRRHDGSTFATSEHYGDSPELMLALDHASHHESLPLAIEAAFEPDEQNAADFAGRAGPSLVPIAVWRWDGCGRAAFAQATDLRQGEFSPAMLAGASGAARLFRWAAALAAVAIVVHVVASIGEWTSLRVESWRARSALAALASDLGVSGADDPATAIARRHADARHRAGLAAPTDALPLLARAAPALAALPSGALKSATYGEGHWTFEFAKLEADAAGRLELQLAGAGLSTLQATNAAGARMRVSLAPGVQ